MDEQEVIRAARMKSNSMLSAAESKSSELRRVANEYADDALRRTEEAIEEALSEVKQSRLRFRSAAASAMPVKQQPEISPDIDVD